MKIDRTKVYGLTTEELKKRGKSYVYEMNPVKSEFDDEDLTDEDLDKLFPNQELVLLITDVDDPGSLFPEPRKFKVLYYNCNTQDAGRLTLELHNIGLDVMHIATWDMALEDSVW